MMEKEKVQEQIIAKKLNLLFKNNSVQAGNYKLKQQMLTFLNYLRNRQIVQNNPIFRENTINKYNFLKAVIKGYG